VRSLVNVTCTRSSDYYKRIKFPANKKIFFCNFRPNLTQPAVIYKGLDPAWPAGRPHPMDVFVLSQAPVLCLGFMHMQLPRSWICTIDPQRMASTVRRRWFHGRKLSEELRTELEWEKTWCWCLKSWKRHATIWHRSRRLWRNKMKDCRPVCIVLSSVHCAHHQSHVTLYEYVLWWTLEVTFTFDLDSCFSIFVNKKILSITWKLLVRLWYAAILLVNGSERVLRAALRTGPYV